MENIFKKNEEKLIKYLKENKNIIAVYLFGSYSDGSYNNKSDVDLAVLYEKDYDIIEHYSNAIDIEKIFENTKIDYIDLKKVNLFFRFKILKKGKVIYIKDENKLYDYVYMTQNQYIEMSYSREKYEKYVLEHNSLEEKNG